MPGAGEVKVTQQNEWIRRSGNFKIDRLRSFGLDLDRRARAGPATEDGQLALPFAIALFSVDPPLCFSLLNVSMSRLTLQTGQMGVFQRVGRAKGRGRNLA